MVKLGTGLALVCLQFYFLTGLSARRPYSFQKVPSPQATANKFMKNFLHLSPSTVTKRQTSEEDIVVVLDGSGSIGYCEFEKGKKALNYQMNYMKNSLFDTKYAAVTFASSATVNFKFLKYSEAVRHVKKIHYPGGWTNTQAGLNEALNLFKNTGSGARLFARKVVLLITDGHSNVQSSLTIPKAEALKQNGVFIYVIAVGDASIYGIDEMVKVATWPPENYLFRVSDMSALVDVIKLVVKKVAPGKYKIINGQPNKPCHNHVAKHLFWDLFTPISRLQLQ